MPLPNQNWIIDPRGRPPILGRPSGPRPRDAPTPTGINNGEAGYTREVQANELASTQMEDLGRGDNRVLQQARMRGVQQGASRGGINSNLAAASGEEAWLGAAGNVAFQQAGAYGNAATQNLDSLARQRISAEGNETSLGVANIGAGASMYNSDNDLLSQREGRLQDRDLTLSGRDFQRSEREGDQGWRSGESQRDRDYTTTRDERQYGYNRELERDRFGYEQEARDNDLDRTVSGELLTRWMDDPETWDDQSLADGFQLYNHIFRPRRARAK